MPDKGTYLRLEAAQNLLLAKEPTIAYRTLRDGTLEPIPVDREEEWEAHRLLSKWMPNTYAAIVEATDKVSTPRESGDISEGD